MDEKRIFKLIQNCDYHALKFHLERTKDTIDFFRLIDKYGKTSLLYAAFKNSHNAVQILIDHVLNNLD